MSTREEAEAAVRYHGSVAAAMADKNVTNLVYSQLNEMMILRPGGTYKLSKGDRIRQVDNQRLRFLITLNGTAVELRTGDLIHPHDLPFPLEIYRYARS